jgi:MFS transporter, DHA2 family, multidrug resistance protein
MRVLPSSDSIAPGIPAANTAAPAGGAQAGAEAFVLMGARRAAAMCALLAAIVLVVLDGAIANVALPSIAQALQVTQADSVWVVTAYQLAVVMAMLPAAALGERVGYRPVFVGGAVLFTVASALCAAASSLPWLVAGRFLQGLGSAAVMPLCLALLRTISTRQQLARAIAVNALCVAAASAAGPAVGAAILSVATWPWLFAVNLPVGALVLVASLALPRTPGQPRRLDAWSIALNAGMFVAFVVGADRCMDHPWEGAVLLMVAVACLVRLVRRELPQAAPLIPLDLLRASSFRLSVIASVCCFTGQMAGLVALPFALQHGLGLSAWHTGMMMTAWPLAVMVAAPLAGHLSDRLPTAWLCAVGGVCLAMGLGVCAVGSLRDGLQAGAILVVGMALAGFGFGLFQTPNNRNMLLAAPPERSGAAGGAQGVARLTGQTLGGLMMGMLWAGMPGTRATQWGLWMAAVLTLAAGLISLLRGSRRA